MTDQAGQRRVFWALAILPSLLCFAAYLPVLHNDFVNWDDPVLIQNISAFHSRNLATLKWMFTPMTSDNWIPLTWLSFTLDFHLGKLNPLVYHLDNLLLHCFNTALVFFLSLRIFTIVRKNINSPEKSTPVAWMVPAAFLAALLFGLHPIHVESVAWASERKDLLCGFFFLSSLLAYLNYVTASGHKGLKYCSCLALFILALMSKPMAVTLPLVMLVLDAWPLRRFSQGLSGAIRDKIPFFMLSLVSGWLTVLVQAHAGAINSIPKLTLTFQVVNAFHSLIFYLWKMLLPVNLTAFYPIVVGEGFISFEKLAAVLGVVLMALACFVYRKKHPFLAVAFLFYAITLFPVLGFLQFGYQAAADRYTYLPSLSPILLFSAVSAVYLTGRKTGLAILAVLLTLVLGMATYRQTGIWKSSLALWEDALRVVPENTDVAHSNLADAYYQIGRLEDALREYNCAVSINASNVVTHNGRGTTLARLERYPEAEVEFKNAAALNPQNDFPHINLWNLYRLTGRDEESLKEAQECVRLNPMSAGAYDRLGTSYEALGRLGQSIEAFQKAVSMEQGNPEFKEHLRLINQQTRNATHGQRSN